MSDFSQCPSQTISPCPQPTPQLPATTPYIVTFHLVSGDLRGGNDKKKLLKNAMSKHLIGNTPFLTSVLLVGVI